MPLIGIRKGVNTLTDLLTKLIYMTVAGLEPTIPRSNV